MNTIYKDLSSLTREQTNHSSPDKSCMTMETSKTQKTAAKPRTLNVFIYSKKLYSIFKFQHPMSIFVVGPKNSGKTYFVDQLLSKLDERINDNPNLKCRICWFYS